jgi:hypothetical protein
MRRQLFLTIGLCFGIGVALASALPVAHASKCATSSMLLVLEAIEGGADSTFEREYWPEQSGLLDADSDDLVIRMGLSNHDPLDALTLVRR